MAENLEVELLYLYPQENAIEHKTKNYEIVNDEEHPVAVLRRGQKFIVAIRFSNRNFCPDDDILKIIFSYGPNPNPIKRTKGTITLGKSNPEVTNNYQWTAELISENEDGSLTLELFAPVDIPVGAWSLQVETSNISNNNSLEENTPNVYEHEDDVYFLFNPWNCHDMVYMPDERLLEEYVLCDVGKIWVGPWGSTRGREWVFGQFAAAILPAILLMFERSKMAPGSFGDPLKVSRCISKLVNSNDDDGILVGRWDGEYDDGTAPSAWTGSTEILEQFVETREPVKYGQCWVFSGVTTTICRALGIPSRVVSNLVSAHDANCTLTVDKYYDENNEELDFDPLNPAGEDSIWNYHVWNDVWMARPDLPSGYGGWQAIDATPQETSSGFFQCGPASVEAIKKGQVGFNYDVAFMIASVNADLMRWKIDPKSDFGYTKIYCNKYHIGRMLLTKQPFVYDPNGDQDRQDITNDYKAKEGSEAERLSLFNAVRGTEMAKTFYDLPDSGLEDVSFDLIELERIKIGEDFNVTVEIKNNTDEVRNISAVLSAGSVFYTGVKAHVVKKAEGSFKLEPGSTEKLTLTVTSNEYLDKLVEYCIMKLYAVCTVQETRQTWAGEDDFQVLKPSIDIRVPEEISLGVPTQVTLRFVNPIKKELTRCKFSVSGPALLRNQIIEHADVESEGLVKAFLMITPKIAGEQTIVATFSSRELLDISGSAKVVVIQEE